MRVRTCLSVLAAIGLVVAATASAAGNKHQSEAAKKKAFNRIVAANTYTLHLSNGKLSGPGAKWLVRQGVAVQDFLIGDRHATAQIPRIVAALYEGLAAKGYDRAALEIGPYTARKVDSELQQGGLSGYEHWLLKTAHGHPRTGEFLLTGFTDWQGEARLAATVVKDGGHIWGLDQEFGASLPLHLQAMAKQAHTRAEHKAVATMRKETKGKRFALAAVTPPQWAALRKPFAKVGDTQAVARIDALSLSSSIYAPYTPKGGSFFFSNVDREHWMKEVLLHDIRHYAHKHDGKTPRILYQFGGFHAARQRNDFDGRVPLGTFVTQWGIVRGWKTFHLFIDCDGGKNLTTGGHTEKPEPCADFFSTTSQNYQGHQGHSALLKHLNGKTITVIDLRPLRKRFYDWDFLNDKTKELILGFDAYMAVPNVTPAKPIGVQ